MDGSFFNNHHLYSEEQEDSAKTPESPPPSTAFSSDQSKHSPTAAAKKGRRGMKKKVVSVRINGETPRSNTGSTTPPSDSWAWRKYGQKPIKGSPYPRAYYRCSSSKGCPARKQVERNRLDPTMLVITYSCEHNHSGPVSRNNNHHHSSAVSKPSSPETLQVQPVAEPEPEPEEKFVDMGDDSLITGDEFSWFGEMETTSSTVLESSIFSERSTLGDSSDVTMLFPMGDDEESLFADLGELPECSVVFRQGGGRGIGVEEQPAQRRITPWCGTTS